MTYYVHYTVDLEQESSWIVHGKTATCILAVDAADKTQAKAIANEKLKDRKHAFVIKEVSEEL